MRAKNAVAIFLFSLVLGGGVVPATAQIASEPQSTTPVEMPTVIRWSGVIRDAAGNPRTGLVRSLPRQHRPCEGPMRRAVITAIGVAVLSCATGMSSQERIRVYPWHKRVQLQPVDEAAQDPSFEAFRRNLVEAVRIRNGAFVIDSAVPELQKRFSGRLDLPSSAFAGGREASEWGELERLLALGGAFTATGGKERSRREFCAPYTYSSFPRSALVMSFAGENENTEGTPWVIVGARVPVRVAPNDTARILTHLSYDLVIMAAEEGPGSPPVRWRGVYTYDGWKGWVAADRVRDPRDWHACFAMIDGRWLMTDFSHGNFIPR